MHFVNKLEESIEFNKKTVDNYLKEPYAGENLTNLLKLSSSVEDIYEDKLQELDSLKKEIENFIKLAIKELKKIN